MYGFLLTIVALSFILITFLSAQYFGDTPTSRNIIALIVAVLIVFGLDPLKKQLSVVTDRVFFKAKVDYQSVLQHLTEILSVELDLNEVILQLETILKQEIKIKSAVVLLRQPAEEGIFRYKPENLELRDNQQYWLRSDGPLVSFLNEHKHASLLESLERKIEDTPEGPKREELEHSQQTFERVGAALATPVFAAGQMNAVLILGPKMSGDSFANEDLQLIDVLSPQIASAIEKAKLYQEVKDFSAGLQQKVETATEELQDRNRSLITLQHITKEITQTLDFKLVTQKIVDAVAHELGYIGAMLFLLDKSSGRTKMMPQAITRTPIVSRAMDLMPKAFEEMFSYLDEDPGLDSQAVVARTIKFGKSLDQFISPTVPAIIARAMTKLAGVKGIVAVPIEVEGEVIGVMDIAMKKPTNDLQPRELETIRSLADEIGIVARNVRLFEQIQETNKRLAQANEELKQLDQAKSEFVSIASHQLRTPMTGIMGYLSMLTSGDFGALKPEHGKILSDLLSESQRMIRLINQFLNVSKIEAGKFTYVRKPVQVADLVQAEVKEVTKSATDKGLKLEMHLPKTPLPIINADGDKLQDVILNLLDNAIKYTDKGTITISVAPDGPNIHVAIKDSGIGIKAGDAHELFSKFVRGTGIAQIHPDGSGLGLFIAKSIIDAHGGKIWAESDGEEKGSTFQFYVPIGEPDAPPPAPPSAAAHVTMPKDAPVLVPPAPARKSNRPKLGK